MQEYSKLKSKDELTRLIRDRGIETWEETFQFVASLPYGRNSNRTDFKLVITEQRGTCSSKHAMLKKVADLNKIPNVKLILGMYRMHEKNTPKIGNVLTQNSIEFIPEAHCYLKLNNKPIDITSIGSHFQKIENDILIELEIEAEQVSTFKIEYHKDYLKSWISENNIEYPFEEIWRIREQCIENLTQ